MEFWKNCKNEHCRVVKIIWGSNLGVYENDILLSVTQVSNGNYLTNEIVNYIFWICVFSRKILKHLAKSWVLHANILTIYLKAFINELIIELISGAWKPDILVPDPSLHLLSSTSKFQYAHSLFPQSKLFSTSVTGSVMLWTSNFSCVKYILTSVFFFFTKNKNEIQWTQIQKSLNLEKQHRLPAMF